MIGLALQLWAGLVALGGTLVGSWRTREPGYSFVCGLFTFAGIYSIADAGFALPGFMTLMLYSALAILLFRSAEKQLPVDENSRSAEETEFVAPAHQLIAGGKNA